MSIRHFVCAALAAAAGQLAAPATAADAAKAYPDRPIRMLVPNAPGSAVDTLSRIVGNKMGEVIGQQMVIDNTAHNLATPRGPAEQRPK